MRDLVITVVSLAIGFVLGQLNLFGKRKGTGEARFDSKTGKEIK